MSLINKMLQDLEGRSSTGLDSGVSENTIRAVPVSRRVPVMAILAGTLAVAIVMAGGWWFVSHDARRSSDAATKLAVASAPGLKMASDLSMVPLPVMPSPTVLASPAPAPPMTQAQPVESPLAATPINAAKSPEASDQKPAPAVAPPPVPAKSAVASTTDSAPPAAAARSPARRLELDMKSNANPAPESAKPVAVDAIPALSKQVRELTPSQRAENDFRRAAAMIQEGKSADAITLLEQVLQADPLHGGARQTLAGLLLQAKRPDEAAIRLQDGLKLDPSQSGAAMILARLQVEKGDQSQAIATLQRTLPFSADRADYQSFLGALLQREGRNREAIDHYMIAVRKQPQNGVWWMGLGISLQAENRIPDAQAAFGRARASTSLTPELQAFVDQKLLQLGRQ